MMPVNAPHHLRANQWCLYREGVVVSKHGKGERLVDVGLGREVAVHDKHAPIGDRVTVKLPPAARVMDSPIGELVSPKEPREKCGLYWGYDIRIAKSLKQVK